MKRYLIDKLAEGLLESAVAAIAKGTKGAKKPIQSVVMWRDSSETFIPFTALISFTAGKPQGYGAADLRVTVLAPKTSTPTSLYEVEGKGDRVRDEFIKANKLKKTDDWWARVLSVPRLLVGIEMDRALMGLKAGLEEAGVKLAPKFAAYNGDPDKTEPIKESDKLAKAAASDLKKKLKTAEQKQAFAELCYQGKERQAWLLELAGA
ncbi:MAG TPA: hypothetical protein VIG99_29665 [Myxococcaceae bacterium]